MSFKIGKNCKIHPTCIINVEKGYLGDGACLQEGVKIEGKLIEIPFNEAYGEVRKDLIQEVSKSNLPADLKPEVGMQLQSNGQDGSTILVTIVKVENDKVIVDANHPLAGKDLVFDIEVVDIK